MQLKRQFQQRAPYLACSCRGAFRLEAPVFFYILCRSHTVRAWPMATATDKQVTTAFLRLMRCGQLPGGLLLLWLLAAARRTSLRFAVARLLADAVAAAAAAAAVVVAAAAVLLLLLLLLLPPAWAPRVWWVDLAFVPHTNSLPARTAGTPTLETSSRHSIILSARMRGTGRHIVCSSATAVAAAVAVVVIVLLSSHRQSCLVVVAVPDALLSS